jgi:sulfatase maturation enzyme AslB (radical SAM superfamily)
MFASPLHNLGRILAQRARSTVLYPIRDSWWRLNSANKFLGEARQALDLQHGLNEPEVLGKPVFGLVETNHTCNLNCPMCDVQHSQRTPGIMDLATFRNVIAQLAGFLDHKGISLHTFGEVMLNPNLAAMLGICREYGLRISITTNGLLINRHLETLDANRDILSRLNISIDGAIRETYEFLRYPGKFDTLIRNLDAFTEMNHSGINRIPIQLHAALSLANWGEIPGFFQVYQKWFRPEDILFYPLTPMSADIAGESNFYSRFRLPYDEFYEPAHKFCTPNGGVIFYNGDVGVCCTDHNGHLVIGNIKDTPLPAIASSEGRVKMVDEIKSDAPPDPCNKCYRMKPVCAVLINPLIQYLYWHYGSSMRPDDFQILWRGVRRILG